MGRMTGKACKVDANQADIVECLRAIPGVSVRSCADMGDGFPDIIVGRYAHNWLFEIKDPDKDQSARELTDKQQKFFHSWTGQVQKVETVQEIIKTITGM